MINGSGNVTTDFLKVAGFPKLDFNTSSTSAWGNVRMRVAMALDNTGSMADDGKMPAMQTAAKSLIDQLSALAKNPGDIYISIVPFAKDVNMGASFDQFDMDRLERLGRQQRYLQQLHCLEFVGQMHGFVLDAVQPWQVDRLRHRPRPGLRHPEHDARCLHSGTQFPAEQYSYSEGTAAVNIHICRRSCR